MSTESVAAAVKESFAARTPLRITGGGGWLDAGRPVRADGVLSLRDESGVSAYVPADLTITVRAATPLSAIEAATRERKQWLPLDPYGTPDGTIGATIATASTGPLASSFGLARDLVLGLEFVNGRGEIVRGGGKVVKNVAGFDLSRLLTGSWGTLGVITELTLRLYALPDVDRSFVIDLSGSEKQTTSLLRTLVSAPLSPYAFQLVGASIARGLRLAETAVGLIRFGGNAASVKAQAAGLAQIANVEEIDSTAWLSLRQLETGSHTTLRISTLPQRIVAAAPRILSDDVPGVFTSIDPRRGVIRVVAGAADGAQPAQEFAAGVVQSDSSELVFEKLPAEVWPVVSPSVVADPLSQGVKRAYDPHNILNPGILGELS
ncbi:MAG TPA: FAD-binding protein [Gemmatimonadaceae bacterium]|nr:FAD-binding protein [Gemmatimonadaceae bacterium]